MPSVYGLFLGVSVHVSNAAPKSDSRGGFGGNNNNRSGGSAGGNRGGNGPDGPGMYPRFAPGPNQGSWGNQGPRGNMDMPNLQALGKLIH